MYIVKAEFVMMTIMIVSNEDLIFFCKINHEDACQEAQNISFRS